MGVGVGAGGGGGGVMLKGQGCGVLLRLRTLCYNKLSDLQAHLRGTIETGSGDDTSTTLMIVHVILIHIPMFPCHNCVLLYSVTVRYAWHRPTHSMQRNGLFRQNTTFAKITRGLLADTVKHVLFGEAILTFWFVFGENKQNILNMESIFDLSIRSWT